MLELFLQQDIHIRGCFCIIYICYVNSYLTAYTASIIESWFIVIFDCIVNLYYNFLGNFINEQQRYGRLQSNRYAFGYTIFSLCSFCKLLNLVIGIFMYRENEGTLDIKTIFTGPKRKEEAINVHKEGLLDAIVE